MGRDTPACARLHDSADSVRILIEGARYANEALCVGIPLTVGLANGCYDLLHPGHIAMLEEAAEHCDFLAVALDDDARIAALKGTRRPTRPYAVRALVVAGLRAVTAVLPISADQTLGDIMGVIRPDTYFCRPDAPEARLAQILGITIWRLERHGPWSTSEELKAIRGNPDRA